MVNLSDLTVLIIEWCQMPKNLKKNTVSKRYVILNPQNKHEPKFNQTPCFYYNKTMFNTVHAVKTTKCKVLKF